MKYPESKNGGGSPTPYTAMVCAECNELFWEMFTVGKIYRCQCGKPKRLANDIEKRDAETFIQHMKEHRYHEAQRLKWKYN
jgi:hypothetical protein